MEGEANCQDKTKNPISARLSRRKLHTAPHGVDKLCYERQEERKAPGRSQRYPVIGPMTAGNAAVGPGPKETMTLVTV